MKNICLLLLCALFTSYQVLAQHNQGVITYELKVNLHKRIPKERENMKAMIPEFRVYQDQLVFSKQESLYKNLEEEDDDEEDGTGGGGMRFRFKRPTNEVYLHFGTKAKVESREFMTKKFLISDTLKPFAWKLSEETKTIQGFVCKKATYYNEERKQNIVAWYAEQIPLSFGPESFHSLFGLVLEVDINEGELVYTTQKLEFRELKKGELKIPSEGKKTTSEEFRKMVEEQMKNMPGGMRIMRN